MRFTLATIYQFIPLDSFNLKLFLAYLCFTFHLYKYVGFPGGSDCKESACSAGDLVSIPGLEKSP